MSRPRRPNKHIEAAVRHAESLGWRVEVPGGRAWGTCFVRFTSETGASTRVVHSEES